MITAVASAPGATSAVITWTTNEPSTSRVDLGPTTVYGTVSSNPSLLTSHSLTVGALTCGTLYHYRVQSTDGSGNTGSSPDGTLTTVPCAPVSDDFRAGPLDTARWTFVNPLGDASVSVTGGSAVLTLPAGLSHDSDRRNQSARTLQPTAAPISRSGEARSACPDGSSAAGAHAEQDGNFLRFDVYQTEPRCACSRELRQRIAGPRSIPLPRSRVPVLAPHHPQRSTWTERWPTHERLFTTAPLRAP
jgi:hypothetical protein